MIVTLNYNSLVFVFIMEYLPAWGFSNNKTKEVREERLQILNNFENNLTQRDSLPRDRFFDEWKQRPPDEIYTYLRTMKHKVTDKFFLQQLGLAVEYIKAEDEYVKKHPNHSSERLNVIKTYNSEQLNNLLKRTKDIIEAYKKIDFKEIADENHDDDLQGGKRRASRHKKHRSSKRHCRKMKGSKRRR